ncbi:hypothetical protein OKW38_006572 [Paraburkholderia sp. MM5496-R1]|uniref:hypothetical protein n=1 Tax=Paraburkholderia TaxID=1822464 RepID=UPI000A61E5F9
MVLEARNLNELTSPEAALAPMPTLREIFSGFLDLGLISFGGALPLASHLQSGTSSVSGLFISASA